MILKIFKTELLLLNIIAKGIANRHIKVENKNTSKIVSPLSDIEINAKINLPQEVFTKFLAHLKSLHLIEDAKYSSSNQEIIYYWISDLGLSILNGHDSGNTSLKLEEDDFYRKPLIEKAISTIYDSESQNLYIGADEVELAIDTLDKDIRDQLFILFQQNSPASDSEYKNKINSILDQQAKRYNLPTKKEKNANLKYTSLTLEHLAVINDVELDELKEHIKNMPPLVSPYIYSKNQSELNMSGAAFFMASINKQTAINIYQSMSLNYPFDNENEIKANLHVIISKHVTPKESLYIARVTIIANDLEYYIGYSAANNLKYVIESIKKTISGKKALNSSLNTPLKRFGLRIKKNYLNSTQ